MLQATNLTKVYHRGNGEVRALDGVSVSVARGEFVAVRGPSGCGKTTLLLACGALLRPDAGSVLVDGQDPYAASPDERAAMRARKIGFVFQQFHLLDRATAQQNVILPLIYTTAYPDDAEERALKALNAVGLADRVAYRPNQLSGGQQQRVAIARALITDPAIILADEPTGNLDAKSGAEVMAIFQRLHREGRTILLVTHDRAVAEHARRIVLLKDGRVAEDQPVAQPRDAEREAAELVAKEEAR